MLITKSNLRKIINQELTQHKLNEQFSQQYKVSGRFGVDAGNVSAYDFAYIKKNGGIWGEDASNNCKKIKVPSGQYTINYDIRNTYKGNAKGERYIQTSGEIVFGDICYLFSEVDDAWMKFLEKTNYLRIDGKYGFSINTGGDGDFPAKFNLQPLN